MYCVFHLLQSDLWETITGENLFHKVSSVRSVKCKQNKILFLLCNKVKYKNSALETASEAR